VRGVRSPTRILLSALVLVVGCGGPAPPAKPAAPARPADAAVSVADWNALCEAQAERARKCPGPVPEEAAACTKRAACFGALLRGDVVRGLARCQSQNDCTKPCSIDRVIASLPVTPTNGALEQACVRRRALCPALDCNAVVRPVRAFEAESTAPLVDCFELEKSCLDVAACVLENVTPVIERVNACGPPLGSDVPHERAPKE